MDVDKARPIPVDLIVDAHEDIAWNWISLGRHPAESALVSRGQESETVQAAMGIRTTGLPEWIAGRVGIVLATLFVMPRRRARGPWDEPAYADAEQAHTHGMRQLDRYRQLADEQPGISLITTAKELERVVAGWTEPNPAAGSEPVVGLVALMEGADPIREPAEIDAWYQAGLRVVGPAWAATRYAGGTGEPGPLTPEGRQLLARMADLNMMLDLSHLAEESYLQAIDQYPGPIIASHSNPRRFLPTDRGLSDEMIHRLAGRGGVVGIVPFNRFLKPGWKVGDPRDQVPVRLVGEAIDYVAQLTGSSEFVGLGSDFDGAYGAESIPAEMDTVADLYLVALNLAERGYAQADIERIMSGNWLRCLRSCLP